MFLREIVDLQDYRSEEEANREYNKFLTSLEQKGEIGGVTVIQAFTLAYNCQVCYTDPISPNNLAHPCYQVTLYFVDDKKSALASCTFGEGSAEGFTRPLYRIAWLRSTEGQDALNHYLSVEQEDTVEGKRYLHHCSNAGEETEDEDEAQEVEI